MGAVLERVGTPIPALSFLIQLYTISKPKSIHFLIFRKGSKSTPLQSCMFTYQKINIYFRHFSLYNSHRHFAKEWLVELPVKEVKPLMTAFDLIYGFFAVKQFLLDMQYIALKYKTYLL